MVVQKRAKNTTKNFKMKSIEKKKDNIQRYSEKTIKYKQNVDQRRTTYSKRSHTIILMVRFLLNFCWNKQYFSIQCVPNIITTFIDERYNKDIIKHVLHLFINRWFLFCVSQKMPLRRYKDVNIIREVERTKEQKAQKKKRL